MLTMDDINLYTCNMWDMSLRNEMKAIEDRHLQWFCGSTGGCSQSLVSEGLTTAQKQ